MFKRSKKIHVLKKTHAKIIHLQSNIVWEEEQKSFPLKKKRHAKKYPSKNNLHDKIIHMQSNIVWEEEGAKLRHPFVSIFASCTLPLQ